MRDAAPPLAIVTVSYNVRELLERCLRSVERAARESGSGYTIIVVDSASRDGSVEMVRGAFPGVEVVASLDNLGFAGGNNVALRMLLGINPQAESTKPAEAGWAPFQPASAGFVDSAPGFSLGEGDGAGEPRYILLLNPDTEIVGDALAHMVGYLDRHPEVVVVGPQLRYGDGTLQSSRRRFPTPGTMFWESTLLEQWWPRNPWVRRYRYDDGAVEHATPAGWLVGAALLVRSEAIRRAGLFDERFWMYSVLAAGICDPDFAGGRQVAARP
jgi:GT2 family glycosyltransferase